MKAGPNGKAAQVQTAPHPTHTSLSCPEVEEAFVLCCLSISISSVPLLEVSEDRSLGSLEKGKPQQGSKDAETKSSTSQCILRIPSVHFTEQPEANSTNGIKFNKWNQLLKEENLAFKEDLWPVSFKIKTLWPSLDFIWYINLGFCILIDFHSKEEVFKPCFL